MEGNVLPSYTFKNIETNEIFDSIMTMAERETFLTENPQNNKLESHRLSVTPFV
jgi:hypothetical protein